ncbi:MAG: signal peptidase I [Clostridia bacterium]|nr:signal peptidase I [Clostridia bacterium]
MSEDLNQNKPDNQETGFKAFWNKPLKMSDKEIEKLKKKGKEIKQKTVGSETISWILTIVTAVVLALVIRTFFFEIYGVEGRSMTNTLQDAEKMFCTKLDYLTGQPQRGDVVICHYPDRGSTSFVKRLVGLPGDTVEMKGHHLYVNGEQIADPANMGSAPNYSFYEYTLKENEYFVLGDNRGNSNDSHSIGPIPRNMIIAHVQTVIWPLNAIRNVQNEFVKVGE